MVALRRPEELPPPPEDGLPVRQIKPHTHDKLHYWGCYLEAASTSTKNKFRVRICADLFAAHGVCEESSGRRVWGTSLLSLQVASPFDLYFFNDINPEATAALAHRAREIGVAASSVFTLDLNDPGWLGKARNIATARTLGGPKIVVSTGNANLAHLALKLVSPPGKRYVCAVIDPESAIYEWDAMVALAAYEKGFDALILFPDEMEVRALPYYMRGNEKLDRCYGRGVDWKTRIQSSAHPAQELRLLYEERLRGLGLLVGRPKTVSIAQTRRALYRLIFVTRSTLGIKLWNEVLRRPRYGRPEELWLGGEV
jgi:hypothetical protein